MQLVIELTLACCCARSQNPILLTVIHGRHHLALWLVCEPQLVLGGWRHLSGSLTEVISLMHNGVIVTDCYPSAMSFTWWETNMQQIAVYWICNYRFYFNSYPVLFHFEMKLSLWIQTPHWCLHLHRQEGLGHCHSYLLKHYSYLLPDQLELVSHHLYKINQLWLFTMKWNVLHGYHTLK